MQLKSSRLLSTSNLEKRERNWSRRIKIRSNLPRRGGNRDTIERNFMLSEKQRSKSSVGISDRPILRDLNGFYSTIIMVASHGIGITHTTMHLLLPTS